MNRIPKTVAPPARLRVVDDPDAYYAAEAARPQLDAKPASAPAVPELVALDLMYEYYSAA
jgi:hypothetical protein